MRKLQAPVKCAVVGYGPWHSFGRAHGRWIDAAGDLKWVAVCDTNPERLKAATQEFPHLETYATVTEMLAKSDLDLVSVVTPHFTHAPIALECIRAKKHVIVDKAMCLSVAEATAMIEEARKMGVMLAVFHGRRHDGNFRAIKEVVHSGAIGDVFHIDLTAGGYGRPRDWWYSDRNLSGGAFYFWGPHALDWVLDLMRQKVRGVTGFHHKLVWKEASIEDQARAVMLFANGAVADVTWSHISSVAKPLWRILGTKGGILDTGAGGNKGYQELITGPVGGSFKLVTIADGKRTEVDAPYKESVWVEYYKDIADHLLRGGPVPVSGEEGRRTIAIFEAVARSSQSGKTEPVEFE